MRQLSENRKEVNGEPRCMLSLIDSQREGSDRQAPVEKAETGKRTSLNRIRPDLRHGSQAISG